MENIENEISHLSDRITHIEKKYDSLIGDFSANLLKNNPEVFLFLLADNETLCYIMVPNNVLFIFKKKSLLNNAKFIKDYMLDTISHHKDWKVMLGILDKNCVLYQEHIKSFDNHTILYKYINRHGLINKSVITEENGELYVENQYLGIENYHSDNKIIYANQEKRKILDGITVEEYIKDKSQTDTYIILRNMYDSLFEQYPSSDGDREKVSGILLDLHTENVIINNEGFHYIDKDVVYGDNLNKSMVLCRRLGKSWLYENLIEYYKLKDMSSQYSSYPLNDMNSEDMKRAREANGGIFKKYLTPEGLDGRKEFDIKLNISDADVPEDIRSHIDVEWYTKQYPDYKQDKKYENSAAYHYITIGWKQGYNPSPEFDGNQYLKDYPDIARAGINPLEHYVRHGKKEGRKVVPVLSKKKKVMKLF